MKQLLFLLLFPCLALAQYPANGNQKISLGEQTTADGLVWRGVASIDTVTATSKITRANKQDTSAFLLLDTVTNLLWHYKTASNGWIQAGGGVSVSSFSAGTTGLTPSTATTGAVTLGGTLAVANGGTNITTFTAANRIPYASSATALTTSSNLTYNNSTLVVGNENDNYDNLSLKNKATTSNTNRRAGLTANTYEGDSLVGIMSVFAGASDRSLVFGGGVSNLKNPTDITFYTSTNVENPADRGSRHRMYINNIGNVGIATTSPTEKLHVVGNARISAMSGINDIGADANGVLQAATSDMNLKNTIEDSPFGLNEILLLNPVTFLYNDENRKIDSDVKEVGFIAQDVFDIIPNAVSSTGTGDLQLDYRAITATLTKAIQEQNLLIKALEQRILTLENK
jgi:hypothetical protein